MNSRILPIKGTVQHYQWGGSHYLPNLLNINNTQKEPFAELWMGAHPKSPSLVLTAEGEVPLNQLIQLHPEMLGQKVGLQFNYVFPYLFKVLDVQQMLSIQSHPTKEKALIGFNRENELGIPLDAAHRNYKDDNHKPEIMVALTDFWLLHGFKSDAKIKELLSNNPIFEPFKDAYLQGGLVNLYKTIMEAPQVLINEVLAPFRDKWVAQFQNGLLSRDEPEYWAAKAFIEDTLGNGQLDRGIFSIFLFNLVYVKSGEGVFQGAGVPHAYLEGTNIELMANSDNVFRGGLTYKHIDVQELLDNLVFEETVPIIMAGYKISDTEIVFPVPVPDFELSKIVLQKGQANQSLAASPEIGIIIQGEVEINDQIFSKGNCFFAPAGLNYWIKGLAQDSEIYKAYVPVR